MNLDHNTNDQFNRARSAGVSNTPTATLAAASDTFPPAPRSTSLPHCSIRVKIPFLKEAGR